MEHMAPFLVGNMGAYRLIGQKSKNAHPMIGISTESVCIQ